MGHCSAATQSRRDQPELGRLFRVQTDFFSKGHKYSVQELREYEFTCERVRELVRELKTLKKGSVNACCQI